MQEPTLAVFDLDHTLFRANSSHRFGHYLYKEGKLSVTSLAWALTCYGAHKLFGVPLLALHKAILPVFRGRHKQEIEQIVANFLDLHLEELLNPPLFKELKKWQNKNVPILLLSNSPGFLVTAIGDRLRVTESKGSDYTLDATGCYSAVGSSFEGKEKAEMVRKAAESMEITISNIIAYSDSHLDLPLLELVGYPVAVSPDKKLRKIARKRKWGIIE